MLILLSMLPQHCHFCHSAGYVQIQLHCVVTGSDWYVSVQDGPVGFLVSVYWRGCALHVCMVHICCRVARLCMLAQRS